MTQEESEKRRVFFDEEYEFQTEQRPLFVQEDSDEEREPRVETGREVFCHKLSELLGLGLRNGDELDMYWKEYGNLDDGLNVAVNKYFEAEELKERLTNNGKKESPYVIDISEGDNDIDDDELSILGVRSSQTGSLPVKRSSSQVIVEDKLSDSEQWTRYIGSIHSVGFATRPTVKPVPVGSRLGFKKSVPKEIQFSKSNHGSNCSHLIRLMDLGQNRELGRVPEEIARIINPLLEKGSVIRLETYLMSNNGKRFSVGDDIYIRIDCYLSSTAFFKVEERSNNIFSTSQRSMSLKQLQTAEAIVALFDAIDMQPVYGNSENEVIPEPSQEPGFSGSQLQDEALNVNQLKRFYRITQSAESLAQLPETTPQTEVFKLILRRYQKQSLSWMLKREFEYDCLSKEANDLSVDGNSMNPLWKRFRWPGKVKNESSSDPKGEFFYANLYTGEFVIEKPVIKTMIKGGILADEMGLGKTISTLALICMASYDREYANKKEVVPVLPINRLSQEAGSDLFSQNPLELLKQKNKKDNYAYKTTLVIVPMSLLSQWQSEYEKANNDPKKRCDIYYGNNIKDFKSLLLGPSAPSVILTTYGVVQSEFSRNSESGLFSVSYFRIVIDEGHTIRNKGTRTSKAVISLQSSRKWVLTGTPIINRLDDLFSLVQFLNLEPWSHANYWKRFVTIPFEKRKYDQAFDVIAAVLEPVLLRRTKHMRDVDGNPLVSLPPKEVIIEKLQLSDAENQIYQSLLRDAEKSVKEGIEKGDLLKNYTNILVHILRLRQVCCHLKLLQKTVQEDDDLDDLEPGNTSSKLLLPLNSKKQVYSPEELLRLNKAFRDTHGVCDSSSSFECAICTTEAIEPLSAISITRCLHTFCEPCLIEYMEFQKSKNLPINCPYCREPISEDGILKLKESESPPGVYELATFESQYQSTKIKTLLWHLQRIKETSPGEQIIVFSQFSSFLDILHEELKCHLPKDQAKIYKFDGRLDLNERAKVLNQFGEKDLSCLKILLLSLKAGGVGLNLTCASHAFMMDPWWSPSMEDQAIDRIHRIGQLNTVKVVRFIVENSVEEKMLRIQERKRRLGDVVDGDESEKREKRIEEIKMLFQ